MRKILLFAAGLVGLTSGIAQAQPATPVCNVTAVPPIVRAEGVSERLGDIVFVCTGTPNREIAGTLTISLNAPVTNRLIGTNLDIVVTQTTAAGTAILPVSPRLQSTGQVAIDNFRFQLDAAGASEVTISNLRADVTQSGNLSQDIFAQLALNPPGLLNLTLSQLAVAKTNRGLLATSLQRFVGSKIDLDFPAPSFPEFISSGRAVSSARVTEGFVAAFEPRGNAMSQGVRILARFNGLPANARVFVPTAIAGSSALRPTAAGDFGGTLSAGEYVPGSRTLLLVRVQGADANGAGGFVQFSPTTSPAVLNELQELTTSNGTALATYEVLDSNPAALESAQLPAFLGLPLSQFPQSLNITRTLSFGPISTVGSVSAFAPVPRFIPAPPPADCDVLRDCNLYRGKLVVNSALLDWEVPQGLAYVRREVIFSNESNSRFMPWTARVEYKTGSGWVELAPSYGFEPVAIGVQAVLTNLQPGIHEATLIIDAGEAGVARIPIRVKLNPRPVDPSPVPTVTSTGSAATFSGSLVPGSLAIIRGTNLGGANLQVTFNGIAARTLYTSSDQLNVEVPAALTGTTAQLVVTAGGVASAPVTVNLAAVSPGIFVPGIRNQDSSVNGPQTPAPTGSYVSVYATGLLPAGATTGNVEVIMHGYTLQPSYAGPAPGVPGVQQVNLQIPLGWPTMLTDIALCNTAGGQRTCSPGVRISLLQAQ